MTDARRRPHEGQQRIDVHRIVFIGLGGLGCPALWALSQRSKSLPAPIHWVLVDDDVVDESNLGRQVLYRDEHVGQPKLDAAVERLLEFGVERSSIEAHRTRLVPETARALVRSANVVLEGADNYATKFLAADSCRLERVPIVHGAALRWRGTALAVSREGRPCYRCLFEELPDSSQNCESAGVMGPVVGMIGALMADLALGVIEGVPRFGTVWTFDGHADRLRDVAIRPRATCPLCGTEPTISTIQEQRYTGGASFTSPEPLFS